MRPAVSVFATGLTSLAFHMRPGTRRLRQVIECDARNLDRFPSGSFDVVIDKGLLDVL